MIILCRIVQYPRICLDMYHISANVCLGHQDIALLKGLDKKSSNTVHNQTSSAMLGEQKFGTQVIHQTELIKYLDFYQTIHKKEAAKEFLEGLTKGFKLNYYGPRLGSFAGSLVLGNEHKAQLAEKINKEVYAGYKSNPPIPNVHIFAKRFSTKIK